MRESLEFRPSRIFLVLLGQAGRADRLRSYVVRAVLLAVTAPALLIIHAAEPSWTGIFFLERALPTIACVAAIPLTIALGCNWYRGRKELYEREHYVALFLLAALVASVVGYLNFLLSQVDRRAFAIDSAVSATAGIEFVEGQRRVVRENSERTLASCERIAAALRKSPDEHVPARRYLGSGDDIATLRTREAEITYRTTCTSEGCIDVLSFEDRMVPTPIWSENSLFEGLPKLETYRDVAAVADRRAEKERAEIARIEADLKNPRLSVPASLFIYQAVMDVLQANPNYFKPVSGVARLVAFLYGCVKFLFLGVFVVLFTKKFAKPT